MNIKHYTKIFFLLLIGTLLFSCTSKKKIVYLQQLSNNPKELIGMSYEPTFQLDDALMIVISAENPEVAAPYNMKSVSLGTSLGINNQEGLQSYLIDKDGYIDFPMLGKIKLAGLTRIEAIKKIKFLLTSHIEEPIVNIRLLNFKVSVLGEVNHPGVFNIQSERLTLLEALSLSGDLTIYGKRNSILVIREKEGIKTIDKVDITSRDFINSPSYYLLQNDVVYVEPNQTKVNNSVIGPDIRLAFSTISLLITIILLVTK